MKYLYTYDAIYRCAKCGMEFPHNGAYATGDDELDAEIPLREKVQRMLMEKVPDFKRDKVLHECSYEDFGIAEFIGYHQVKETCLD